MRTPPPWECPQRARVDRRLIATSTSPEALQSGADESRLLAPGRRTHLPSRRGQWCYECVFTARYSGGAAPASHRFPWLPSAIDYAPKLSAAERSRKHDYHRPADQQRQRDHEPRIDRSAYRRGGQIDYRH